MVVNQKIILKDIFSSKNLLDKEILLLFLCCNEEKEGKKLRKMLTILANTLEKDKNNHDIIYHELENSSLQEINIFDKNKLNYPACYIFFSGIFIKNVKINIFDIETSINNLLIVISIELKKENKRKEEINEKIS